MKKLITLLFILLLSLSSMITSSVIINRFAKKLINNNYEFKESDDDKYNTALSSILRDDYRILHQKNYIKPQIGTLNKEINTYRFVTAGIVSTAVIMVSLSCMVIKIIVNNKIFY